MNGLIKDPTLRLGSGTVSGSPEHLTDSEMKLLKRLQKEERKRYVTLICSVFCGILFIWLYRDAADAYQEMWRLPYSAASKDTLHEALHIMPWLGGVFLIVHGVQDCFFNRRRRLMLKLATKYEQNRNAEQAAPSDGEKPAN